MNTNNAMVAITKLTAMVDDLNVNRVLFEVEGNAAQVEALTALIDQGDANIARLSKFIGV